MIPFPALAGALMDAHDRIETVDRNPNRTTNQIVKVCHDTVIIEAAIADLIGWSRPRVCHRGVQLWGQLRGDTRFTEVAS